MGPPSPGATRELGVVAMVLSLIDIRPEGRAVNTYESSLFTRVRGRRILSSSYPRVCIDVPLGLWVVSFRPQASDRGSQDIWMLVCPFLWDGCKYTGDDPLVAIILLVRSCGAQRIIIATGQYL